jgi:hybrid cluster-associated redox disulfide protein
MGQPLTSTWTVEEILRLHPETTSAFLRMQTQCVGCWLARFCTLADVASNYHLELAALLETLDTRRDSA